MLRRVNNPDRALQRQKWWHIQLTDFATPAESKYSERHFDRLTTVYSALPRGAWLTKSKAHTNIATAVGADATKSVKPRAHLAGPVTLS